MLNYKNIGVLWYYFKVNGLKIKQYKKILKFWIPIWLVWPSAETLWGSSLIQESVAFVIRIIIVDSWKTSLAIDCVFFFFQRRLRRVIDVFWGWTQGVNMLGYDGGKGTLEIFFRRLDQGARAVLTERFVAIVEGLRSRESHYWSHFLILFRIHPLCFAYPQALLAKCTRKLQFSWIFTPPHLFLSRPFFSSNFQLLGFLSFCLESTLILNDRRVCDRKNIYIRGFILDVFLIFFLLDVFNCPT